MNYYLAIDVGGTFIKYGKVDGNGKLLSKKQVTTPFNEQNAIINRVEKIVMKAIADEGQPLGIGISTAGVVDTVLGEVIYAGSTIANYDGTNFKQHLETAFSIPVIVNNDVNAALLGEQWQGAARGQSDVYCITLGTGIGGAYFHNKLVTGTGSKAGEVGYLLYDQQTNTTYEQRASASALNERAVQELGKSINLIDLFASAKEHDLKSNKIIDMWACDVAEGLAQIIIIVDPKLLLIGGGISHQGDFLLNKIERYIDHFLPENFNQTELRCTALGNDAALLGAVSNYFK
jgi:predicted NBD/HSP70 family sugar kinase